MCESASDDSGFAERSMAEALYLLLKAQRQRRAFGLLPLMAVRAYYWGDDTIKEGKRGRGGRGGRGRHRCFQFDPAMLDLSDANIAHVDVC